MRARLEKLWIIWRKKILARQTFEGVALKDICYGYGEEASLASVVVEELKKQHKTITAAESLTAGLFQATLADFFGECQLSLKVVLSLIV